MKYIWRLMFLFMCFVAGTYFSVASELCDPGYFRSSGKCSPCPNTCESCWAFDHCDLCKLGYYGETCSLLCPSYCTDCSNTGRCKTLCPVGTFASRNQSCLLCPQNCIECNETYCFDCKVGFTGPTCQQQCVNCRPGTGCHKEGFCLSDCKDSFSGKYCNKTCPSGCSTCERLDEQQCITCLTGRYGQTCQSLCNEGCRENMCGKSNGSCLLGCKKGYSGTFCDPDSESSKPYTILTGVVVGILMLVVLVSTALIIIYRKRSHRHSVQEETQDALIPPNQGGVQDSYQLAENRENLENPERKEIRANPISRAELEELVASKTNDKYQEEFKYILGRSKSFFKPIPLNDGPAGVLNASFIDIKRMAYIVCKAPTCTENVMETFWKMIVEEKCAIIVLLSNRFMSQQRDDNTYFPKNDWQHVSEDVQITYSTYMFFETHCTTEMDIQTPDGDRRVMVLHFTGGFEADTEDRAATRLANFLTHVRILKTTFPQLVCSSDGISLCGIYVALDMLAEELESTNQVNIMGCVSRLLQKRPDLIQTADEYEFIHKALVSLHKILPEKKKRYQHHLINNLKILRPVN